MQKSTSNAYGFNVKEEFKTYRVIGQPESEYHNYMEWHDYVYERYEEHTESTLINFQHYLQRERRFYEGKVETLNSCVIPFGSIVLSVLYTLAFSIVNLINTYNGSINSTDEAIMKYEGYTPEMVLEAFEQNLHSGIWFYILGGVLMIAVMVLFICVMSKKVEDNRSRVDFYSDYIEIIQEIKGP